MYVLFLSEMQCEMPFLLSAGVTAWNVSKQIARMERVDVRIIQDFNFETTFATVANFELGNSKSGATCVAVEVQ